jgi:hypothetical protein
LFDVLQDILIITDSGKVIASKVTNPQIEEQLFGMLISALSSFAEELADGKLNNLEFCNLRFDIVRKENFLFLGSSSRKIKHKKALKTLENISELFFKYYPKNTLKEWNGTINIFDELDKYIKKSRDELIIELVFKEKSH